MIGNGNKLETGNNKQETHRRKEGGKKKLQLYNIKAQHPDRPPPPLPAAP